MERADTLPKPQTATREESRRQIVAQIHRLERAAGHGLWGMVLFLLVSFAAFHDFAILPTLPDSLRHQLGSPPPAEMISLALVVYAFSGIVYNLARMNRSPQPWRGLMHAAFLSGFYAFYHLGHTLPDNFWAVFFAGLSVLGLENYTLWANSSTAVRKQRQRLERLDQGLPEWLDDEEDEESGDSF